MYDHDQWLERYVDEAEIRGNLLYVKEKPLVIGTDGYGSGYKAYFYWDAVEPDTIYCVEEGVTVHPWYGEVDYRNAYIIINPIH